MLLSALAVLAPAGMLATSIEAKNPQKKEKRISFQNRKRIREIIEQKAVTTISLPREKEMTTPEIKNIQHKDTIKVVNVDGTEMFLMKAIQDEDGNSVANEVLDAAVVTARFRNIAEQGGKVDLEFQIVVPQTLMESRWQLRYRPTMYVLQDSVKLDRVFITGKEYRKRQLRGYEQYNRFISKIITDSTKFIMLDRLEIFLQRNIPQVYAFKNDTTFVSDEDFEGFLGVREGEAIDHFTKKYLMRWNDRRIARKGKMYERYVKAPYITEGIRLDTVIQTASGNYVYNYIQTLDLKGKKKLKKVDIVLDGEVFEQGDKIYDIPRTDPLTFYISSISAFVDGTEHYIKKIIERRATANRNYKIDFPVGKSEVLEDFGENGGSIRDIKQQLRVLLNNDVFTLDSVIVEASASPEGSVTANGALSKKRSEAISAYFNRFMKAQIDSLNREDGFSVVVGDDMSSNISTKREKRQPIKFTSSHVAENWNGLNTLVEVDTVMTVTQKEQYFALCDEKDLDRRENRMKTEPWYKHMRDTMYPRLRTVQFRFNLARKGMTKDTVQTTVIDSLYMAGVAAIRDRDYELAVKLLGPYNDYNAAIAYAALDRNNSAIAIFEQCPKTAEVNYMLAIIYARFNEDQKAVQAFLDAVAQNNSYKFRGNLDPEISVLIKRYGLFKDEGDEGFGF